MGGNKMDNRKTRRFEVSSTLTRADRIMGFTTLPFFVIALLTMAILASCSKKVVEDERTFLITGTVIDVANSEPVDSAKAGYYYYSASFNSTYTDSGGTFRFVFLTGGGPLKNVRVLVSKQGYTTFDTLIVRLDGNLTDWIIGLQRVQNVEKWEWKHNEYQDRLSDSGHTCPMHLQLPPRRTALH
jgi:hypothetical protein